MPDNSKHFLFLIRFIIPILIICAYSFPIHAYEGIETYYVRYDIKSSNNTIVNDNLLMIPAKNDFRAENFSQISSQGVISAAPGDSKALIDKRIREQSLKTILVKQGLKSVETKDHDTVVSYEGVITAPVTIIENEFKEERNGYVYKSQVEFSPIAFPDRWESLSTKFTIKKWLTDFFQLFK